VGIGTASPKEKIDSRGAAVFSGDNTTGTNAFGTAEGILLSTGSGVARVTAISNGANNVNLALRSLSNGGGVDAITLTPSGAVALSGAVTNAGGVGITFPASQFASSNANTLDDYEEGTFTPTVAPSTSGTITLNSDIDRLAYTKIGRVVYVQGLLEISSVSSPVGASVFIQGLPFTTADLTEYAGRGGTSFPVKAVARVVNILEGQTQVQVLIDASTLVFADQFYVSFNYIAA
jgi:hypothetical protein